MHWLNQLFRKNTGLSPYVWIVFYILPFYFIFQSVSTFNSITGITLILGFFICYVLSFVAKGWMVYFWTSVQIVISTAMGVLFSYIYFSLFLAFFIGNLRNRVALFILYSFHIFFTFAVINYCLIIQNPIFMKQLPFVLLSLIGVILIPVNTYSKNKEGKLIGQLEDANKRISELVKLEERQRIARDLHDTLGQKLSLIGLKSDLASKLIYRNPRKAQAELGDIRQTARMALKEVRAMVTRMRGTKLTNEIIHIGQILKAARIEFTLIGDPNLANTSLMAENVVSMCLKEAVTNVVKHSKATACTITIEQSPTELIVHVKDDGVGMPDPDQPIRGNGLQGMKERLEFVNGSLDVVSEAGTMVMIRVPNTVKPPDKEDGE